LDTYSCHEGSLPPGYTLDYEPAIFNTPPFLTLLTDGETVSFLLLDHVKRKGLAAVHFHLSGQYARSPGKAPFGSIECSGNLNPMRLYRFLEYVETQLAQKGITGIYLKNPPRAYNSERISLMETFLINHQYGVSTAEISTIIRINDQPFVEGIRNSERLRLRQGQGAGFVFQQLSSDRLSDVYRFISGCHRNKGYHVSITEEELQQAQAAFPLHYLLFAILQSSVLVAASVCIRIDQHTLYNFIANHEKEFNQLSPPVMLTEGIYEYCRQNQVSLLDMGTSALEGKPNFPLLDFKMHMGGRPTSKFSFYKKIN
jgi:hypothetical protein